MPVRGAFTDAKQPGFAVRFMMLATGNLESSRLMTPPPKPVKILVVEDREEDYHYLCMLLRRPQLAGTYELDWAVSFDEGIARLGGTLLIPPLTFAQVLVATSDSVVLGSELDDVNLYRPVVEMYVSAIKLP